MHHVIEIRFRLGLWSQAAMVGAYSFPLQTL